MHYFMHALMPSKLRNTVYLLCNQSQSKGNLSLTPQLPLLPHSPSSPFSLLPTPPPPHSPSSQFPLLPIPLLPIPLVPIPLPPHTHMHSQFARHESISLLSQVVRAYPSHSQFTNMTSLTHQDPEVDFFENIKHIQQHRRTRALRRLAEVCAEGSLTQASIMTFLLPLASQVGGRPHDWPNGHLIS